MNTTPAPEVPEADDRSVLATESAWTEQGRIVPAEQITARFHGDLQLVRDPLRS